MKTRAVILAGGKGTRLGQSAENIPKPMVKIGNVPILEHQIKLLRKYGIKKIVLITGYLSKVIEDYFGDGGRFHVKIDYFIEDKPLGTAGGIKHLEEKLTTDFIVLYGDVMINMDIRQLLKFHKIKRSDCTLVLHPNGHPYDSDLVEIDEEQRVIGWHAKPHVDGQYYRNLVNAGVYVLSPNIISHIPGNTKTDFGRDIFPKLISYLNFYGYSTPEYIKDMGIPERLDEVQKDYLNGKIELLNRENKRAAIFLDRDGVINQHVGLLYRIEDFKLIGRAGEAVKKINDSSFLAVVVTNQPVVARNLCSVTQLEEIHRKMDTLLGKDRAKLDAVYYCPHHPDKGYPEENRRYKINCRCRKPKTGMIKKAQKHFNIDIKRSFLIGDSLRDIQCGKKAGLTTIAVATGQGCKDGQSKPDYVFADLYEAVDFIVGNHSA